MIITGLSPEIAQTLVTLGVDLSKVNAVGDLQGGIEEAERLLGYAVIGGGVGDRGREPAIVAVPILKQGPFLIASIQSALTDTDVLQLRDDVMAQVTRHRSRGIIVDVTALDVMDSFVSRSLRGIAMMTRLRGAETVIVGIQPEVAFAMVQLGMSFEDVQTALDLEEGLALLQSPQGARRRWRLTRPSGSRSSPTPTSSPRASARGRWRSASSCRAPTRRCSPPRSPRSRATSPTYAVRGEVLLASCATRTGGAAIRSSPATRARDRRPRARDAGRLHDRRRARAGAAGRAPAGRRVRHRDRARAGHDGHARQVDAR